MQLRSHDYTFVCHTSFFYPFIFFYIKFSRINRTPTRKKDQKKDKKSKLEVVFRATQASQNTMICTTPISY